MKKLQGWTRDDLMKCQVQKNEEILRWKNFKDIIEVVS